MPEVGGINPIIIGAPNHLDNHIKSSVLESIEDEKKKKRKDILLAQLSPEEQQDFGRIEMAAGNLINAKLGRLEIEAPTLDRVTYATNPKVNYREGYYDPLVGAVVYANRPVDTFDKYSTIAHAVSHLSTKNEVRQYLSDQDRHAPHRTWVSGAEVVGNKQPLAGALEEGMATMDQVDFFNTYLQVNHTQEYTRRRQAAESSDIKKQVEKSMNKRLYGEISPLTIAPFVVLEAHHKLIFEGTKIKPTLDVVGLKQYLFARKMCEVLGKSLAPDKILGQEEAIQLGRDEIDKDRYLRTQDAHRKIVVAMGSGFGDPKERSRDIHEQNPDARGLGRIGKGGIRAKTIFAAKANDQKSIDAAMAMLRYVHPLTKPLVDVNQPLKPNPYKAWIESTPPAPIRSDRVVTKPVLVSKGVALEDDALEPQATVRPAQIEKPVPAVEAVPGVGPEEVVRVIEGDLPPIVPPAPESSAQASRVGVQGVASPASENPRLTNLQSDLRVEEGKLRAAKNILADILAGHPDRKMDDPEAERRAIEEIEGRIYYLSSEINQINNVNASPRGIEPPSHP